MRVMVIMKASKESEAGIMPTEQDFSRMGDFNEQLVKAGVLQGADGLKASSHGKRIRFEGTRQTVIDGPFAETKELVAGYWIWQVKSMDEAVEWAKKIPSIGVRPGEAWEVEIRPFFEVEDFGDALTPEHLERVERMRAEGARKQ